MQFAWFGSLCSLARFSVECAATSEFWNTIRTVIFLDLSIKGLTVTVSHRDWR